MKNGVGMPRNCIFFVLQCNEVDFHEMSAKKPFQEKNRQILLQSINKVKR